MLKNPLPTFFNTISGHYFLLNKILTFGLDGYWRKLCVDHVSRRGKITAVDICSGTGEMALKLLKKNLAITVVLCDFSPGMMREARKRLRDYPDRTAFVVGDVSRLPFKSGSLVLMVNAFGFRNLFWNTKHRDAALGEIQRTLHQDGEFVFVETSQPENNLFRRLFHLYMGRWVPVVGRLFSKSNQAYRYLGGSVRKFPDREELRRILMQSGLATRLTVPLSLGAISIFSTKRAESHAVPDKICLQDECNAK